MPCSQSCTYRTRRIRKCSSTRSAMQSSGSIGPCGKSFLDMRWRKVIRRRRAVDCLAFLSSLLRRHPAAFRKLQRIQVEGIFGCLGAPFRSLQWAREVIDANQFRDHIAGSCSKLFEPARRRKGIAFDGSDHVVVGGNCAVEMISQFGKMISERDQSSIELAAKVADLLRVLGELVFAPAAVHGLEQRD